MEYEFVKILLSSYDNLKMSYKQNSEKITVENIIWRDDMKFLAELCMAFKYFLKEKQFPFINFKKIPPLSNARWNSRAIMAFLAYILIDNYRSQLHDICVFISGPWSDVWFSNHNFDSNHFGIINEALENFPKAKTCFNKHWIKEPSAIPCQRSNICAERGVKIIQNIYPFCKSVRALNLKFQTYN